MSARQYYWVMWVFAAAAVLTGHHMNNEVIGGLVMGLGLGVALYDGRYAERNGL